MAGETNTKPKTRRNWGRVVLVISLGLNLLIVGLVAGAMLGGPRDRDRNPVLRDLGFGPFYEALPRAEKREIGNALRREAGTFRKNRAAMRTAFENFLTALRAEPFDPAAAARIIEDQSGTVGARQALARRLLLERIGAMSPAARAEYADTLGRALRHGPRRRE